MKIEIESCIFRFPQKSLKKTKSMQKKNKEDLFLNEKPSFKKRLSQLGMAGVVFFTVKGLLWLIIPFLIAKGCIVE